LQGNIHVLTLAVKCFVDDDGRHCRAKATCGVILIDDNRITFGSIAANSLKEAEPVE